MPRTTVSEAGTVLKGWRRLMLAAFICIIIATLLSKTGVAFAGTRLLLPASPTQQLYQSWVDTAQVPTANKNLVVKLRNCDENAMTCMVWHRGGPQLYFPDLGYLWFETGRSASDRTMVRSLFLHELGHVWDYYASRRSHEREKFMRIMHLKGGWWSWKIEDVPPGEQFADAYSYCAQHQYPEESGYEGYRAYRPSRRQHQRVCALIQTTG